MGCDISWVMENVLGNYEGEGPPAFVAADVGRFDRNYAFFAQMANVRNNGKYKAISKPRGLPDNLHPATQALYEEVGTMPTAHRGCGWKR